MSRRSPSRTMNMSPRINNVVQHPISPSKSAPRRTMSPPRSPRRSPRNATGATPADDVKSYIRRIFKHIKTVDPNLSGQSIYIGDETLYAIADAVAAQFKDVVNQSIEITQRNRRRTVKDVDVDSAITKNINKSIDGDKNTVIAKAPFARYVKYISDENVRFTPEAMTKLRILYEYMITKVILAAANLVQKTGKRTIKIKHIQALRNPK